MPRRFWRVFIETVGLQTARGRLLFVALISILIFLTPYKILAGLSLWQRLGFEHAPSIGLTRAYWHLLHLDPVAAWHRNSLIFAVLIIGIPQLFKDIRRILAERKNQTPLRR